MYRAFAPGDNFRETTEMDWRSMFRSTIEKSLRSDIISVLLVYFRDNQAFLAPPAISLTKIALAKTVMEKKRIFCIMNLQKNITEIFWHIQSVLNLFDTL